MAESIPGSDRPFQHYTLKHRVVAWISIHLFDHVSYTVGHGLLKGMKRRGGMGWVPEGLAGGTDTAETRFWRGIDLRGKTVYDVGAFHGLLTLWFAQHASRVICFEPNKQNHQRLLENLALNKLQNVTVRNVGIGSVSETRRMVSNPLMPGGSTVDARTADGLVKTGAPTVVQEISISTLDEEIPQQKFPPPGFIKIDIEGWEIEALKGARQTLETYKPALFLEMHGETMREKEQKVSAIVRFLWDLQYHNIQHVETGTAITPENALVAVQGHLYCRPSGA
ncbi:MAG: FkbM family methyltransferase [Acidobacteriota bacterium]